MSNTKAISNESIIAALIQAGTVKEAAERAGTTPRTIYDRMKETEFRREYMQAKNDIIRKAVFSINEKLSAAVEAVADIMQDKNVNAATRLQAAQTIIQNAGKFSARLMEDETTCRKIGASPLDFDIL